MTISVTVAAPAARATPAASGGSSTDSAAPFASALDGALAGRRDPVGDAPSGGSGQQTPGEDRDEAAAPEDAGTAPVVVDTAAVSVAAALWAMTLAGGAAGSVTTTPPTASGVDAGGVAGVAAAATGPVAAAPLTTDAVVPGAVAPSVTAAGTAALPPVSSGAPGAGPAPGSAGATPELSVVPATSEPVAGTTEPGAARPSAVPSAGGLGAPGTAALPQHPGQGDASGDGRPDQEPGAAEVVATPGGPDGDAGVLALQAAAPAPAVGPVADTDAATGPAAQPVAGQLARQVAVLSSAGNGAHTMTMVLNPENLGPVEVQVTIHQGSLDLHLRGAHDLGRAALLEALPELRRDLEAAGLSPSRVEVDADAGGSWLARHAAEQQAQREAQQGFADRQSQQNQQGDRSRSWGRPADSGEGATAPTNRSASSGVDVLA